MPRAAEFVEDTSAARPEEPAEAMEPQIIADRVLQLLEERGVPSGTWLVDIAQTRRALRDADALLRRLEDAIVRTAA